MNRPIKFRVWDFFHKQWITGAAIELNGCIINTSFAEPETNCIAQQYTGLNDKDNNPIFEGDLVELHTAANDHAKNIKENHYGLYEIYWDRKYKLKEIKPNWFLKVVDNDCASFNIMKVVGNVFENPELLK